MFLQVRIEVAGWCGEEGGWEVKSVNGFSWVVLQGVWRKELWILGVEGVEVETLMRSRLDTFACSREHSARRKGKLF